jgi:hypothetical protein
MSTAQISILLAGTTRLGEKLTLRSITRKDANR